MTEIEFNTKSTELRVDPLVSPTEELRSYLSAAAADRDRLRDEAAAYLENASGLRVLVIGETIIDEYEYCETIGKSGKEPIVAARFLSREKFAGGVLAVANQLATITPHVTALTCLGASDSQESFIRASLRPEVTLEPIYVPDAPTIVKRRFVEAYPLQKLFELYVMNGHDQAENAHDALLAALGRLVSEHDLVVVADYGHGMIHADAVELLCATAPFLSVNTQTNADNRGFNTISKYRRADHVSLSENEIRLEARSRQRPLREIIEEVAEKLACSVILVTRGRNGCVSYGRDNGYHEVPALTSNVVDRIGAGDAVLAVTSVFAAQRAAPELIGLVGNIVGAQAVGVVANSSAVDPASILSELGVLLA